MAVPLLLLHHLFLKTSPSLHLLKLKTISLTPTTLHFHKPISSFKPLYSISLPTTSTPTLLLEQESEEEEPQINVPKVVSGLSSGGEKEEKLEKPILTTKEKKDLAAYAHSLGKKLKCQQVGKSGVNVAVATAFSDNLESNELLKVKVHSSCPGELNDVLKELEETTGSVAVGHIGRTFILYRPSLTKMKAEEKKKQHRRVSRPKVEEQKNVQVIKISGRGRRGSSRFADGTAEQNFLEE